MEEFKAEAQGGTKVPPKSHSAHKLDETVDREEDSESSMPCSLPGDMEAGRSKRYGPYSVFLCTTTTVASHCNEPQGH